VEAQSEHGRIAVLLGVVEPMFRRGLRATCEEIGLLVSREFWGHARAVLTDPEIAPAVAVVEAGLLGPDPAATVDAGSVRHRILVVASSALDKPRMLRAGASGFLRRMLDANELHAAVVAAHAGELFLGDASEPARPPGELPRTALTRRETDVLRLLADGHSTGSIAAALHLGASTVKAHLRNANGKLGVRSRAAATAEAMRLGLL
jgi:DNA-binding NarL/FixJ family response regulator